jgi:predicted Zn finger-like uncharacterized protein
MYAQCPDCLTVFSLDAGALAQARGAVICGNCETLFDALETLADQLPPEPFRLLTGNTTGEAHAAQAPKLELAIYRPRAEVPAAAEPAPAAPAFTPRFAHNRRAARPRERRWPWVITCVLLTVLLAGQLAWAERGLLIADPTVGAWLRQACASLGCRLPLVRDVRRLHLVARDVQAHPSVPGALMISATIRNDAAFAQPYPVVSLVLSDADGHRVAMRRLRPAEYLDDREAMRAGLAPGTSAALLIEVADPGTHAVAFEFGFE